MKDIRWVRNIPNYPELAVKEVWKRTKNIPEIARFLPDFKGKRMPNRQYLFNVIFPSLSLTLVNFFLGT